MPVPGAPEPLGRVAFSPDDASPSRARLARVAEMLREAEEAAPAAGRRQRDGHQPGVVVSLLPRRVRTTLPKPRTGGADVSGVGRAGAPADLTAARRRT